MLHKTTTMAKASKPISELPEEVQQEFIENPAPTANEATIEVKTGEVVVKIIATGEEFTTTLNNWNSVYKHDVVSEGVYKYELLEEKKKLLS